MTEFLLVRHATAGHVDRFLAGRAGGIRLDEEGHGQARALAQWLGTTALDAVYTSPLERCRETAEPIAARHGVEPAARDAFTEVDFGAWTGLDLDALDGRDAWRWWNESRGTARPPGGEAMADVLARALEGIRELAEAHEAGRVAVVSHSAVIRALLAHFLGFPMDNVLRVEVDPASVSVVRVNPWGATVAGVNWRVEG